MSIVAILASIIIGRWAFDEAIAQVDSGKIFTETPGKGYALATEILNVVAGFAFAVGVLFLALFAVSNVSG